MARAPVNTRRLFKEYILRRLGFPVIEINIDDEQLEDRIDDAIKYYQEYHFDGQLETFIVHQLTADDIASRSIPVGPEVIGVIKMIDGSGILSSASSLFNVEYQMAMNDFFNISAQSLVPYYLSLQHIELFKSMFSTTPGIRFNRRLDRIFIDTNWSRYSPGQFVVFQAYIALDPEDHPEIWSDRWLQRYATALVKKQWGENIKKFTGIQLLGGVTMDGQSIYTEAVDEITKLEEEMVNNLAYHLPLSDMIA